MQFCENINYFAGILNHLIAFFASSKVNLNCTDGAFQSQNPNFIIINFSHNIYVYDINEFYKRARAHFLKSDNAFLP